MAKEKGKEIVQNYLGQPNNRKETLLVMSSCQKPPDTSGKITSIHPSIAQKATEALQASRWLYRWVI